MTTYMLMAVFCAMGDHRDVVLPGRCILPASLALRNDILAAHPPLLVCILEILMQRRA